MTFKYYPKTKDYTVKCEWGVLLMRFLNVNPKVYGPEISHEELMKRTSDKQPQLELKNL